MGYMGIKYMYGQSQILVLNRLEASMVGFAKNFGEYLRP